MTTVVESLTAESPSDEGQQPSPQLFCGICGSAEIDIVVLTTGAEVASCDRCRVHWSVPVPYVIDGLSS